MHYVLGRGEFLSEFVSARSHCIESFDHLGSACGLQFGTLQPRLLDALLRRTYGGEVIGNGTFDLSLLTLYGQYARPVG